MTHRVPTPLPLAVVLFALLLALPPSVRRGSLRRYPHRRDQLRRLFKRDPQVTISADIDPLEHFDLAVIATPPKFHSDYYQQLLEQTDRFLIEKPLATSVAKAVSLFESARDHNRPVFVNLIRRTLSGYRLIRDFYRSGHFGELQQVKIAEGGIFNWNAVSLGSFSKDLNGGGVLMDTGPHTIDLLLQVFDDLELDAAWMDASANGTEANCSLQISADGVIPVSLILSRNRVLSNTSEFHFAGAICRLSVMGNAISVHPNDSVEYQILPPDVDQVERPSFADLFDAFYNRYLKGDAPNDVGPEESLKALRLIESAYANAQPIRGGF